MKQLLETIQIIFGSIMLVITLILAFALIASPTGGEVNGKHCYNDYIWNGDRCVAPRWWHLL